MPSLITVGGDKLRRDAAADTAYAVSEALATWHMTTAERAAMKEGRRAGKIATARQTAREIIQRDAERRTFSDNYISQGGGVNDRETRTGDLRPFTIADKPTTLDEARFIIDAAEQSARRVNDKGRRIGRGLGSFASFADPARMTPADVSRIADRAARVAARMAARVGRKLSTEEYADLRSEMMIDVLERGNRCEPRGFNGLPRWRSIEREGDDSPAETLLVDRWAALTFNAARRWVLARADRLAAESSADADDNQRLEDYAQAIENDLAGAEASLAEILHSVRFTRAEQTALRLAFNPKRGPELAAAAGQTPNAFYVQANRGRKSLAERWPTERDARHELRSVPALQDDLALRAALRAITAAMRADVAVYHGASLQWPQTRKVVAAGEPCRRLLEVAAAPVVLRSLAS